MTPDEITEAQRRIGRSLAIPRTRTEYRKAARWWELEARRMYPSHRASLMYARNLRLLAELAGIYGPGTLADLRERSGATFEFPTEGDFR